jgi:hypothetical protein
VTGGGLLALMAELEPRLSTEAVLGALEQAAARHDGRHRIAAAVTAQPELLTGEGARAPVPGVLRFISALARAGSLPWSSRPAPAAAGNGRSVSRSRGCAFAPGAGARPWQCSAAGAGRSGPRPTSTTAGSLSAGTAGTATRGAGSPARSAGLPACRRGHRGRAGLSELPPGPGSSLQHLRGGRQRPGRHLAGYRHTGMRTVPQALDHLLTLRNPGTAKGRHAARAALRPLSQPRPGLLETLRILPGDLQLSTAECTRCSLNRRLKQAFTPADGTAAPGLDRLREAMVRVNRPTSCWTG